MAISREKKEQVVSTLENDLKTAKMVVFTGYKGLKMDDLKEMRIKGRDLGVSYKITKKTLLKIAAKNAGIELSDEILSDDLAMAVGVNDEIAPAKIMADGAKSSDFLVIKGGYFEGKVISAQDVKDLALLPGREELYAKIVGSLASPLSGMVNVLSGNMRGLVTVLDGYLKSRS